MAFCAECGHRVAEGAKFCTECGTPVWADEQKSERREYIYESKVHKCPRCGEQVNSFTPVCPACGLEFRGKASVVREFSQRLERAESRKDREMLIRNFYIPNTKEDITEFAILAAANIETDFDCQDAWVAKLEQVHHKAELLLGRSEEFAYIRGLYDSAYAKLRKQKIASHTTTALQVTGQGVKGLFALLSTIIVEILKITGKSLSFIINAIVRVFAVVGKIIISIVTSEAFKTFMGVILWLILMLISFGMATSS